MNVSQHTKERLESIRESIQNEDISYGEIAELQSLAKYIDRDDMELLMWAYSLDEDTGNPIMLPETSILILGRRWFDKTYGNTYHTAEIWVDGERVGKTEVAYGYGDQYITSGVEYLQEHDYLWSRDLHPYWRTIREEMGLAFDTPVVDVQRKGDL